MTSMQSKNQNKPKPPIKQEQRISSLHNQQNTLEKQKPTNQKPKKENLPINKPPLTKEI